MPAVQKKRPASFQDGRKAKKARISKQTTKHGDESVKKRRQPVTLPVKEINEEDSDEEFDDVESGDSTEESPVKDEMDVDYGSSKDANGPLLGALTILVILMCSMN